MKTGLRLMFAKRFWPQWILFAIAVPGGMTVGHLIQKEYDKEAYAMRGRTNMYRLDYEKLQESNPSRVFWK